VATKAAADRNANSSRAYTYSTCMYTYICVRWRNGFVPLTITDMVDSLIYKADKT